MRNSVANTVRKCKKAFYAKPALKLKSESLSSKDLWSTLKKFIFPQSKSSVPPLELNNSIYTDDYDKANIINIFFQRQKLLEEQNAVLPDLHLDTIKPQLSHIVLSPNVVERVLETLPIGKASGPNAISNCSLRELPSELSTPLCSLFNHSLHTGCVPISYKEVNVTPVPKKGDLSIVSNYRPISLLNSEDKVSERLVFKHLYNHLHRHNLISTLFWLYARWLNSKSACLSL